jgi:hypothetical protein
VPPGRAGYTLEGDTAGADLAIRTEMAVIIGDDVGDRGAVAGLGGGDTGAGGVADTGNAGVAVRPVTLAALMACARTALSIEPSKRTVFPAPFPDVPGAPVKVAGTGLAGAITMVG